jgi:YgiT-type zinc finger domain-containing protein
MTNSAALTCPQCQIGLLQPTETTYSGVHHGMLISVPNMPSWTCDICEHHEFDEAALIQIEALVGQLSLPTEVAQRSAKRAPIESEMPAAPRRLKP